MKKGLLLITSILLLTTTARAQDSTAKRTTMPVQPQPVYKIFMFQEETAIAIYNMMGACPDDVKGVLSLKEARKLYADEFNHQPKPEADTVSVVKKEVPTKKKKK